MKDLVCFLSYYFDLKNKIGKTCRFKLSRLLALKYLSGIKAATKTWQVL